MSGVDRISLLPDPILSHILSFLPTKTVIQATTILSRRWTDLWLSVPTVQLPSLKSLHMDGVRFDKSEYLEMILSGCPNIQELQIKDLNLQPFIPLAGVTLTNLIHMELFVSRCQWFWIAELLNSCPVLQVLDVGGDNWARALGLPDQPVPGCLSSHLRACTLRNFDGADASMEFATYILENARVLNKMSIYCWESIEVGDRYQILRKICKVPRACRLWLE